MAGEWIEEQWSRGILLGLRSDENSGYRAEVWFEYTRNLFNQIREGSLIAVRNFSDHPRQPDGSPDGSRSPSYEEYSILQIDQVQPWHYAIQGSGEDGYPGFVVAAAESARSDWTSMDSQNRDDVSRVKCVAIPLRLAFRRDAPTDELPRTFADRSMPMPGFEAMLLSPVMTEAVLNSGVDKEQSFELGRHVVQYEVDVEMERDNLVRIHFGIFGYTGSGKSNLVSTLADRLLQSGVRPFQDGDQAFKVVLVDLMDEYTGLLVDHLVNNRYSGLVVCGRRTLPESVYRACEEVSAAKEESRPPRAGVIESAARAWSQSLILPSELKSLARLYEPSLARLILDRKIRYYETSEQQGIGFRLEFRDIDNAIGAQAYGGDRNYRNDRVNELRSDLEPLINRANRSVGPERDRYLSEFIRRMQQEADDVVTNNARNALGQLIARTHGQMGSRPPLAQGTSTSLQELARTINYQPDPERPSTAYYPSLTIVTGESEVSIADFMQPAIESIFEDRRTRSILNPAVAFIVDEADVFINSQNRSNPESLIRPATLLARRGRKFGLGLGIATQRAQYLDTSIMAQPHTYFVSKLPRKSDRDRVAEAFAIGNETFDQTFSFTVGQWLVTSHDATGLKGVPFPVQVPNANERVRQWLASGYEQTQDQFSLL